MAWQDVQAIAKGAYEFWKRFLVLRRGAAHSSPLAAIDDAEFMHAIRAVSWVESQHGTSTAGNKTGPHDPMQCGHPKDSWWMQLTKQTQEFDRFVRGGTGSTNYDSWQLPAVVRQAVGWNADADTSLLDDFKKGHGTEKHPNGFTRTISFWWGIPHLIWKINVAAGDRKAYQCGSVARAELQDGCVAYNGGGDPTYRKKIEAAYMLFVPATASAVVPAEMARHRSTRGGRWGHFEGRPRTEWQDDGRLMTLMDDFAYVDRGAKRWRAASGITIDGASIPQAVWSIIGGPYEGKYRNAAVVHDAQCLTPHGSRWEDVHRMFYAACRAGGVRPLKALLMFTAVWLGGPRWTWPAGKPMFVASLSRDDVLRSIVWIRAHPESTLADVEELTRGKLRRSISDAQVVREKGRVERWRNVRRPIRSRRPRDKVLD